MDKCCTTTATATVAAAPALRGRMHTVPGLPPLYISGALPSPRVIVCAPDIFGIIPVSMRFLDELNNVSGIPVVVVDHFRGAPWRPEDFPPREGQNIRQWIEESAAGPRASRWWWQRSHNRYSRAGGARREGLSRCRSVAARRAWRDVVGAPGILLGWPVQHRVCAPRACHGRRIAASVISDGRAGGRGGGAGQPVLAAQQR